LNSAASPSPGAGRPADTRPADGRRETAPCDYCGAPKLVWRKCKLICEACGTINKSCADL